MRSHVALLKQKQKKANNCFYALEDELNTDDYIFLKVVRDTVKSKKPVKDRVKIVSNYIKHTLENPSQASLKLKNKKGYVELIPLNKK